jgi:uncharacterized OB-fold protein
MNTITAYKCKKCGLIMYPHHFRCLQCQQREFEQISPSEKGKLLTFTIVEQLPWGIDERGRILGIVEFDNGVKALGLIFAEKPTIGMKLKAGWDAVREIGGEKVYGLTFQPA